MKITHIPAYDINESVNIGAAVESLMRKARLHKSYRLSRSLVMQRSGGKCLSCNKDARDAHHKKPLWADATEYIINHCRTISRVEVMKVIETRDSIGQVFELWNSPENLHPLCFECHTDAQKDDDRYWRKVLGQKYRLVYTKSWMDKYIKTQFKKNRPAFSDYVDAYFSQPQELW